MYFGFANVLIFLVIGLAFVLVNLILSRLVQTRFPSDEKNIPYECGEDPIGDTRIKFNTRFYIIALIFLIFDVEIVFLFPWGVVFKELIKTGFGWLAFGEMLVFIAILLVGLAYVWAKGDLEWIRTIQTQQEEMN